MTLISLRLDLISHWLLRRYTAGDMSRYSAARQRIYPEEERVIKTSLANIISHQQNQLQTLNDSVANYVSTKYCFISALP